MSRLPKSRFVASLLLAWIGMQGCTMNGGPGTHLQKEIADLQRRTIPPSSTVIGQRPPTLRGWVASADWEFEAACSGDTYRRWLADKLRPDFEIDGGAGSDARFVRYSHGDVETLSVETSGSGGTLRVAVKFEAYPD